MTWPDNTRERFDVGAVDRVVEVRQGIRPAQFARRSAREPPGRTVRGGRRRDRGDRRGPRVAGAVEHASLRTRRAACRRGRGPRVGARPASRERYRGRPPRSVRRRGVGPAGGRLRRSRSDRRGRRVLRAGADARSRRVPLAVLSRAGDVDRRPGAVARSLPAHGGDPARRRARARPHRPRSPAPGRDRRCGDPSRPGGGRRSDAHPPARRPRAGRPRARRRRGGARASGRGAASGRGLARGLPAAGGRRGATGRWRSRRRARPRRRGGHERPRGAARPAAQRVDRAGGGHDAVPAPAHAGSPARGPPRRRALRVGSRGAR